MSHSSVNFLELEQQCALNFVKALKESAVKQVIYLSGISNDQNLSHHLTSHKAGFMLIGHGNCVDLSISFVEGSALIADGYTWTALRWGIR